MTLVKLGDTARFINGVAFKPADWADDGLPIIRIQNLTGTGESFNRTNRRIRPELVIEPGDLLVSWSATLDAYRWTGPKGVLNQHIFKVLPKEGVSQAYLFFALKQVIAELDRKTHGSTMKHVVRGDFESTRIPLPSPSEQLRVVDLLSRAENIVRMRREAEQKAKEIIPALFVDMFGDPWTNPKGESAEFEPRSRWRLEPTLDKTIGELLAEGYLVLHKDGNHGSLYPRSADFTDDGVPFLAAASITDSGDIDRTEVKRLEKDKAALLRHGWIQSDDVLLAHNATVGPVGMYNGDLGDALIGTSLTTFRVDPRRLHPTYLWGALRSAAFQGQMKRIMKQALRNQVPITAQRQLVVRIAPFERQTAFSATVGSVKSVEKLCAAATAKATFAFQSLLAGVFGEVA